MYFSRAGGLEETRAIFLKQNGLPERWRQADAIPATSRDTRPAPGALFTIGELGFGTGLNFCATVQAFRKFAPPTMRLRFYSCESRPLNRDDLSRALSPYQNELASEIEALLAIYPPPVAGSQLLCLDSRIQLVLLFGDAQDSFAALETGGDVTRGVNAWYLDGFAPARNPGMWSPELFRELARLSAPDASFATYTAAGAVRRALATAGFRVEKIPGFAAKREMLRGTIDAEPAKESIQTDEATEPGDAGALQNDAPDAIVIGAGLAGAATTRALVRRGYRVTVIERERHVAAGASGNALGVAAPAATAAATPLSRLTRAGLYYLRATLRELGCQEKLEAPGAHGHGALLIAHSPELERRYAAFATSCQPNCAETESPAIETSPPVRESQNDFVRLVDPAAGAALAGTKLGHPALYFPDAVCVSAPRLCEALLASARLESTARARKAATDGAEFERPFDANENPRVVLHTEAIALERQERRWNVRDAQGALIARAATVVLANAADVGRFEQCAALPLQSVRGQSCALPVDASAPELKTALCYDGYITPASRERASESDRIDDERSPANFQVGATFEAWNDRREIQAEQNRRLIERLCAVAPDFTHAASVTAPEDLAARVAFRSASPDRLPVIGAVPDAERWRQAESDSAPEFRADLPGLFVITALGSRGLVYAGIGAEILSARIMGEIVPIEGELMRSVSPDRFLRRELRRAARARPRRPGQGARN